MRLLKNAAFALVVLAAPAAAAAQVNTYDNPYPSAGDQGYLTYLGEKGAAYAWRTQNNRYDVYINNGYTGSLGGDVFDMYCVDPHNNPLTGDVYITPLAAAGDFTGTQYTYNASRDKYLQAAWLISNYTYEDPNSETNAAIQGAIWQILGGNWDPTNTYAYNPAGIDGWVTAAQSVENYSTVSMDRYAVLSGADYPDGTFGQEFIVQTTATPEPATWLMLLTGLISVGGVGLRRKLT